MVTSMILTGASLIATVIILNIFYHDPSKKVPDWAHCCVLDTLASVSCFKRKKRHRKTSLVKIQPENVNDEVAVNGKKTEDNATIAQRVVSKENVLFEERESAQEIKERNKREWARLARIIDRLCFLIAVIAVIGSNAFFIIALSS